MLISDVMTKAPACCKRSDTLTTVAKLMVEHDCGIIPVCDGTQLVGVITDRDLACRAVAEARNPTTATADDVMTRGVYTVGDDEKLYAALELMEERLVRRLPVVNAIGDVVGIVSEADLVARVGTLKVARALKSVAQRTRKAAVAAL
jgi:CBS domain-containing protein